MQYMKQSILPAADMGLTYKVVLFIFISISLVQTTNCKLKLPDAFPAKWPEIKNISKFFKTLFSPQNIAKTGAKLLVRKFMKFPKEISEVCTNDVKATLMELVKPKMWSNLMTNWPVKMLDSFGNPPSGITTGNYFWLGSFQQCLDVVAPSTESSRQFTGEYCLVKLYPKTLPAEISNISGIDLVGLNIGLCFPSTCSFQDKSLLLNYTLKYAKKYVKAEILKEYCQTKETQPMDSTTIAIICVFAGFFVLVLTATLVDLSSYSKNENTNNLDREVFGRRILESFSAIRSLKAIFKTNEESSDIRVIHGIRSISILWVIGGHIIAYLTQIYPWRNQLDGIGLFDQFFIQPLMFVATISVSSFFVISGFLVTYLFIQRSYDRSRSPNIFSYYALRYLRLTPPLLLVVLFLSGPFYYLNKGPVWPEMYEYNLKACRSIGWMTLMYIENFTPSGDIHNVIYRCLPPSWYLSADTQLYIFAPIILYPLYIKPFLGLILMGTLFASTTIASITQIAATGQETFFGKNASPEMIEHYLHHVYRRAYYHAPSYMIGMSAGYLLFVMQKNRIILSKKILMPCWMFAITILLTILYGTYPYFNGSSVMGPWMSVTYGVFAKQAWALAISWIILACALGYGGIVNWLLTRTPHVILGRLTYCAYLVHSPIIQYYFYGQKDNFYFSLYNLFMIFLATILVTMIVAVLLAVLIEMPIVDALKQMGGKYDKPNHGPMVKQLTFERADLEKSSDVVKPMMLDSSQDETEDEMN